MSLQMHTTLPASARPAAARPHALRAPFQAGAQRVAAGSRSICVAAQAQAADTHEGAPTRRDMLLMASCITLSMGLPAQAEEQAAVAVEAPAAVEAVVEAPAPAPTPAAPSTAGQLTELSDDILAYKFLYPTVTASGKELKMILAHPPEKYSSAAPLTADARQRIVCELLDLRNFVSASVSVGPASGVLKGVDSSKWKPYDVALTVLIDRSTSRLTSGQRTALNDVERANMEERDGVKYWVYEHVSQGSPTALENDRKETYRHALSVTAVRPDSQGNPYLYTLNMSCRQAQWQELEPLFKEAVASFRLTPPGRNYISPDINPWQFW